jgi:hypothetical protein
LQAAASAERLQAAAAAVASAQQFVMRFLELDFRLKLGIIEHSIQPLPHHRLPLALFPRSRLQLLFSQSFKLKSSIMQQAGPAVLQHLTTTAHCSKNANHFHPDFTGQ